MKKKKKMKCLQFLDLKNAEELEPNVHESPKDEPNSISIEDNMYQNGFERVRRLLR